MNDVVKEKSEAWLTVSLFDKAKLPEVPNSLTYRIDEPDTDTEVLPDTPLGPASVVEILLTSADNTIIDTAKAFEKRRVTIHANYGVGKEFYDDKEYIIQNLKKVT